MSGSIIGAALAEAADALARLRANQAALDAIQRAAVALAEALRNGHRVYSCGNGGSLCDAMHFAEELSGRFRHDRPPLPATAIADASHITCTANDYGYEHVFARYVQAHARRGDVLLGISTSGQSPNIVAATEAARAQGVVVIALTGREGSRLSQIADIEICTPGGTFADRVQELHIKVIHVLIECIEHALFAAP